MSMMMGTFLFGAVVLVAALGLEEVDRRLERRKQRKCLERVVRQLQERK